MPSSRTVLPEGLEDIPPGPELAWVLAGIERTRLNGHDLVTVLQARARQLSYDQAELYADMCEIAHCPSGGPDSPVERRTTGDEFAADDLRAALAWTRRAADAQLDLAFQLVRRLPAVWEALHRGRIDLGKARVIVDHTSCLDEETARQVAAAVLGAAGRLTTGQLSARVRRMAIGVDHQAARRRYRDGLEERRLAAEANPDGTYDLVGCQLPPQRVAAAVERIGRLAREAKTAADPRSVDQIRADLFLDLLEGRHADIASPGRGTVDLHVDLATLVGLSDQPGEIPGYGPVIADIARQVATGQQPSQWRVTVTDPDTGQMIWNGTTRRRPSAAARHYVHARQKTCVFPGCRAPATHADLDHTVPWSEHGPTHPDNLGPLCRHDHRLKHEGEWQLQQDPPGCYVWTSRLGHTYLMGPQPP